MSRRSFSILHRLRSHSEKSGLKSAIQEANGTQLSYTSLWDNSSKVSQALLNVHRKNSKDLEESRVTFLCPPGGDYASVMTGVWRAGGIAVPMCTTHPKDELSYVLNDCQPSVVVGHPEFESTLAPLATDLGFPYLDVADILKDMSTPSDDCVASIDSQQDIVTAKDRGAYIVYTSGTTGRPKGVVHTHAGLNAHITDLITSWKWTHDDRILHFLPLHHIHGIVNKLLCSLYAGATCEFIKFDPVDIWRRFIGKHKATELTDSPSPDLTLFMAVPTIYAKLIEAYQSDLLSPKEQKACSQAASQLRLMVSGSAALPMKVLNDWKDITGHLLLERYGMTEFAMGLSNPLDESKRKPGYVGTPLPSIQARICATLNGQEEADNTAENDANNGENNGNNNTSIHDQIVPDGESGELRIKGDGVFRLYLNREEDTLKEFDQDGYFKTGDIARYDPELESFQILGRASVDIIKNGGYKISALDVERALLEHPYIQEVAVLGIDDDVWGQRVAAIIRPKPDYDNQNGSRTSLSEEEVLNVEGLRLWAADKIAHYKVPSRALLIDDIPKNAMGKVNKKQLVHLFQ